MGEVRHVLTETSYQPDALPYASRLVIEHNVGETIHVHVGNIRTEFTPEQFLWFADHCARSAKVLRKILTEAP